MTTTAVESQPQDLQEPRVTWAAVRVASAGLVVGLNAWVLQGEFLPLPRPGKPLDYIIVSASLGRLLISWAVAVAVLLSFHVGVVSRVRRPPGGPLLTLDTTRYLNPLFWLALSLVPLLNLFRPLAGRLSPWSYFLFDLRWWWWPLVAVVYVAGSGVGANCRGRLARMRPGERWVVLAVAAIASAVVWTSTPSIRSKVFLVGDEPKYVRYCEAFYQGLGFDLSHLVRLSELPPGYRPHLLQNVTGFLAAVPEETANLARDAAAFLHGERRFNRAKYLGMWFVQGKRPGSVYQVHQPGLGIVLLPAYLLDRLVFSPGWSFDGKFPARLPALSLGLLALFAVYAASVYRLLRDHVDERVLATALALLAMLSMPVSGMAFQVYPEIAAGICIAAAVRYLVSARRSSTWSACAYGALAAYPIWLHVRFGLATLILAAWMLPAWRRHPRAAAAFTSAFAAVSAGFCLYAYRLTGSLLPTAVYDTRGGVFSLGDAVRNLPAALIDLTWGVLPHAPIYFLALPGLWLAWRRRPRAAMLAGLVFLAVLTSAGHDYAAGGTTPGRYLASSMPLLMLFVADAVARFRSSRVFSAALAALALISVETAVTYSRHDFLEVSTLVAPGFSGWRPNELFPEISRAGLAALPVNTMLAILFAAVSAGLVAFGFFRRRSPAADAAAGAPGGPRWTLALALKSMLAGFLVLAAAGTAVALWRGEWFRTDYLVSSSEVGGRVLSFHLSRGGRCALCATAELGQVDPVSLLGASAKELHAELAGPVVAGRPVQLRLRALADDTAQPGEKVPAWGSLRVDFGDGTFQRVPHVFGEGRVEHVFQRPGSYRVTLWFTSRKGEVVTSELTADVAATAS